MHQIIEKYIQRLIYAGVATKENREYYLYGIQMMFSMVANFSTAIVIGYIFGMLPETFIFMLIYLPLRVFAGGYHAKNQTNCYVFGIVLTTAVLLCIKFIPLTELICMLMVAVSCIVVFFLSPVEDKNKPLDEAEIKVYKKNSRIILFLESCIFALVMILGIKTASVSIAVSLTAMAVMLLLGYFKNTARESKAEM